jgi:L,D-peptidoglycan transpeptidase YkuD (ErfK/YbiS/YcfS/YnhG family)
MMGTWRRNRRGLGICLTEFLVRGGFIEGAGLKFRAAIGKNGVTAEKREGDGATPVGVHRLLRVVYRADRVRAPACVMPVEPIGKQDGWCDDPGDAAYNLRVTLPYAGRHERLWREDGLYDVVGVLDWNRDPVVKYRGSAIFLHVAAADFAPTEGCVGLAAGDLRACLAAGLSAVRVV